MLGIVLRGALNACGRVGVGGRVNVVGPKTTIILLALEIERMVGKRI